MWSVSARRPTVPMLLRWLLLAGWPVHALFGICVTATAVLAAFTSQSVVLRLLGELVAQYVCGVVASFAVHELGHLLVVLRVPGVTGVTLERTAWRLSVFPHGSLSPGAAALSAVAGPACAVLCGALLLAAAPGEHLHGWYLLHAVFLLPVFGDGRVLFASMRARRRRRAPH